MRRRLMASVYSVDRAYAARQHVYVGRRVTLARLLPPSLLGILFTRETGFCLEQERGTCVI